MRPEEVEKLLGGYATGTLSAEERRSLFEAALTDQRLFDALVREEALRELLSDSGARQRLLETLGPRREPVWRRTWEWLRQPAAVALAGSAAVALIAVAIVLQKGSRPAGPAEIAQMRETAPQALVAPPDAEPAAAGPPAETPPPARRSVPRSAPARPPQAAGAAEKAAAEPGAPDGVVGGVPALVPRPEAAAGQPRRAEQAAAAALAGAEPLAVSPAGALPAPPARANARDLYLRSLAAPALGFMAGQPPGSRVRLSRRAAEPRSVEPVSPVADMGAPAPAYLGVRYRLLRRQSDGRFSEADPAAGLRPREPLRLVLEPNDSGYLYVLQREASGGWRLLWSGGVQKAVALPVPPVGALAYEQPGRKELFVMLSRRPDTGVAQMDAAQLDELAARARGRLLLEPGAARERATYVVDPTLPPSAQQIAFAITLEVR